MTEFIYLKAPASNKQFLYQIELDIAYHAEVSVNKGFFLKNKSKTIAHLAYLSKYNVHVYIRVADGSVDL